MTQIHRVHAGLSARREEGRVVFMRWQMHDEIAMPVAVAVMTPGEWVETICALSPDWDRLTPADQALRRDAVIRIVEGRNA